MTNETEAPELKPCPFCKGGETRIEPCGQTWMGQQYSEPQFYRLTHHGKLPEGDGFETCHIQFRARTPHDIVYMWNDTRADLPDAQDARIAELEALTDELDFLLNEGGEDSCASLIARAEAAEAKLTDCDPYLKDHETPAQRLESNHKEALSLMKLLEQEKRHSEVWVKAARVAEAKLAKAYEEQVRLEAKLAKAVRLMELSVELATWNTTLLDDVIFFITELKESDA